MFMGAFDEDTGKAGWDTSLESSQFLRGSNAKTLQILQGLVCPGSQHLAGLVVQ